MNRKQILATLIGIAAMGIVYYVKFTMPIAALKRSHPEIFATNSPTAVVGGLSGVILLLIILVAAIIAVIQLRSHQQP